MSSPVAELDTAQRGHHPDSPSSLQASDACPCFENEQRDSKASDDGVLQHKAAETRDLSILNGDEAMEQAVQKCMDYEDSLIAQFRLLGERPEIHRETYLSVGDDRVKDSTGKSWVGITGGFPDEVIVGEKKLIIPDWKFGRIPVTPTKDNLQGMSYALGALQRFPRSQEAETHFFAPYQRWSVEEQRLKYVYSWRREDMPKLEFRIRQVIATKAIAMEKIKKDDWSMAKPKVDLCIWCKHKGACHKAGALVVRTAEKYHDLEVPDEVKEYRITRTEQVAQAYRFANQVEAIAKAMKKRCVDASVTEDLKPEGFSIVKSCFRKVKTVAGFLRVASEFGITEAEALEMLSVSIGTFENKIKADAPPRKGAPRIREFTAALEEAGVTEKGKPFFFIREAKSPAEKEKLGQVTEIEAAEIPIE